MHIQQQILFEWSFSGKPKLDGAPQFFSCICSRKEQLGISDTDLHRLEFLNATQPRQALCNLQSTQECQALIKAPTQPLA